jgi:hypothetical protein
MAFRREYFRRWCRDGNQSIVISRFGKSRTGIILTVARHITFSHSRLILGKKTLTVLLERNTLEDIFSYLFSFEAIAWIFKQFLVTFRFQISLN